MVNGFDRISFFNRMCTTWQTPALSFAMVDMKDLSSLETDTSRIHLYGCLYAIPYPQLVTYIRNVAHTALMSRLASAVGWETPAFLSPSRGMMILHGHPNDSIVIDLPFSSSARKRSCFSS